MSEKTTEFLCCHEQAIVANALAGMIELVRFQPAGNIGSVACNDTCYLHCWLRPCNCSILCTATSRELVGCWASDPTLHSIRTCRKSVGGSHWDKLNAGSDARLYCVCPAPTVEALLELWMTNMAHSSSCAEIHEHVSMHFLAAMNIAVTMPLSAYVNLCLATHTANVMCVVMPSPTLPTFKTNLSYNVVENCNWQAHC